MRKLTIYRKRKFISAVVVATIMCDNEVIGSVRSGQTAYLEIDENKHVIQCCFGNGTGVQYSSDVIVVEPGTKDIYLILAACFGSLRLEKV